VALADSGDLLAIRRLVAHFRACEDDQERLVAMLRRGAQIGTSRDVADLADELESLDRSVDARDARVRAAMRGERGSQYLIAESLEKGASTPSEVDEARRWYECAALQGDTGAMRALSRLAHAKGDMAQAYAWLVVARESVPGPAKAQLDTQVSALRARLSHRQFELARILVEEFQGR
jgi:TPR repeat protein